MFIGCKTKVRTGKREWSMLIQAALVSLSMEIEIICFYFLLQYAVKFVGENVEIPINIFINCYVIFNCSVLPTASFICVKRFRHEVKHAYIDFSSKIKKVNIESF